MTMILKQEVHTHCIIFTVDNTFDRWLIASAKVEQYPSKHDRNLKPHALNLSTYTTYYTGQYPTLVLIFCPLIVRILLICY